MPSRERFEQLEAMDNMAHVTMYRTYSEKQVQDEIRSTNSLKFNEKVNFFIIRARRAINVAIPALLIGHISTCRVKI